MNDSNTQILIVDDNPTNIDLLRRYLEPENYRISAVTSGEKAIALAGKLQPNIILLDIMMPGIGGYETCVIIKNDPLTKHIPIIFVTAKVAPEDLRKGFAVGGADYITKPVDQDVLLARVSYQLSVQKKQQLERQLLEKSQYMASLGELVAEITHEVASPLGNIQLIIGALKSELRHLNEELEKGVLQKKELTDFFSEYMDAITTCEKNSLRAETIMTSFKSVAVSQCRSKIEPFNLRKLVEDVLQTLIPKLKRTQHQINIEIPIEIELTTYSGALIHIITNLINNALIHGFENIEKGVVDISASVENDRVTIIVDDDGNGIPKELIDKIFTKFFTTKAGSGGSGLGLHICQKMAEEELQGTIQVISPEHKGCRFVLEIKQHVATPSTGAA